MNAKLIALTTFAVCCIIGCFVSSCREEDAIHYSPEISSPPFGVSDQSLEVMLEWHDADPVGDINGFYAFDVYLGTMDNNLELVASDLLIENFRCSSLELNTTYFWKVVAKANGRSMQSEVGKFVTTGELQKINVGEKTIMVYPGDYIDPDPSSLTGYSFFPLNAGASSWEDGELNTKAILDYYGEHHSRGWGAAATYCDQLDAYGYSDWYLPAILEIDAVVTENDLSKYATDEYWSSTEYQENFTRALTRSAISSPSTGYDDEDKLAFHAMKCRCVRKN